MNSRYLCCTKCDHVFVNTLTEERYCTLADDKLIWLRWHKHRPDWCPLLRKDGDKMTEEERKTMMILVDTIEGEINRMCVTKDLSEFDTMYGHAKKNLDNLSKMIYDRRFRAGDNNESIYSI